MTPRWWMLPIAAVFGALLAGLFLPAKTKILDHVVEKEVRVAGASQVQVREVAGPTRIVEKWRTVSPPTTSCPEPRVVEHERVIERGPSERDVKAAEAHTATESVRDVLHIAEAPPPRWAVFGGLQAYPEVLPVAGVGLRLFGPVWAEGWVRPRLELATPAMGLQLRVTW
jgi:hypothetical protein